METTSTTSSAASSVDGRSVGGGSDGGFLNLGMFSGSGVSSGNTQQQLQHQPTSELLVGGSNAGYSLANGFGNISTDSNLGNPGSGSSFDLNDFPSLGGGSGSSTVGGGISGSGSGIAAALRVQQQLLVAQQQQQQQQQQQMIHQNNSTNNGSKVAGSGANLYRLAMTNTNGNFNMTTEDFPALPGGPTQTGSGGIGNSGILTSTSLLALANNTSSQRTNSNGEGLYVSSIDAASNQLDSGTGILSSSGLSGRGGLRGLQQPSGTLNVSVSRTPSAAPAGTIGSSVAPGSVSSATAGSALSGDYGLLGLLSVIRMTDSDRNALALGSDLSLLGLNIGTTEQIYSTFASPWSDSVATKEPHYQLPMCYYMQPPALKTGHLSKFQLETLFYIFYALPKDVLQAYAAQELYTREWRYHGDLKLWFKRAGPSDGVVANSSVAGTPPQYLYFDINSWERRLFNGSLNQNITNGFLAEEEVRVKL